jgi:murein DD-endopeptidase MepM/ murein hydrolase activator NlpD
MPMDAWHKVTRGVVALVTTLATTVALVGGPAGPADADRRDDAKRAKAAVARASSILEGATARARAAARRLDAVAGALPGARERVVNARGRVVAARVTANTARRAADRAAEKVEAATLRYAESARRVVAARERVADFVSATYKGGDLVSLNALLDARTPDDITQRAGYLDRILTEERGAIDGLMTARREAKQHELDAVLARREAEQARARADSALTAAETAERRAKAAVSALAALAAERSRALTMARGERAASLARYRRARAEAARIEAQLRAWEARQHGRGGGPVLRPGARLLMPVRGWKSSDFGMRFDPYFHVWQLHAGVDLAAPGGAPIYAAASGRVMWAGYNGGYGNFTCLSHGRHLGRGMSTCYAHQSRILAWTGQWVRRGQVIGRVGTTGASTGHHLHFEVRLDGRPSQPLPWLPSCLC